MGKFLLKFFIILTVLLFSIIIYLAYFGIETDRFDKLIKQKANETNNYAKLDFNKTKIHLNIRKLNIFIKLQDPKILLKGNVINLSKVNIVLSAKSLYKPKVILRNAEIAFEKNSINDLSKITNIFFPKFVNKKIKKIFKKGTIEGTFKIPFSKNGKYMNSYIFAGKILNADININNDFKFKNLTSSINYEKYPLEKIEELRLVVNKGMILNLNLSNSQLKVKFKNKKKIVEANIETKGKLDFENIKKISLLSSIKTDNFANISVNSNLKTKINFVINDKFKLTNKKYQVKGKINTLDIELKDDQFLKKFIPTFKKNIKFKNSTIDFNYLNQEINNQNIKLEGFIKLNKKFEKIKIDQSYNKKNKEFSIKLITNSNDSEIFLPIINYNKKIGTNAKLDTHIKFVTNKYLLIEKFDFSADKNKILLDKIKLNKNFEISNFKKIEVKTYNNREEKNNDFKVVNSDKINVSGEVFDAEPLLKSLYKKNKSSKKTFSKNFNSNIIVKFKKTLTGTFDIISDFSMVAEIQKGSYEKFVLKGNYSRNDKLEMSLYKIDKDTKTLQVISDRAKPFVNSFDFVKGFEGGKLIYDSTIFKNSSKSNLLITDFKVSKVPALAQLLTLASLQGIADTLSGDGIRFELFEMQTNSADNVLNIEDALAMGPAVSILLDGYVDKGKVVSLRGTLVPATKLNSIIASIPLVGDILVGKKTGEGVVGVSFKMKGPPRDIKTTVNPIKTLTPRFIVRAIEKIKKNNKDKIK